MLDISIEKLILQNLVTNEQFTRQALPYIKEEYFAEKADAAISVIVDDYFRKSNELPHKNIMLIEIKENNALNDKDAEDARTIISEIYDSEPLTDTKWLLEQTEQWCRDRSMYLSIVKAISIYDGTDKTMTPHSIPDMIKNALAISFETRIRERLDR